jgi:hypothetical protein
MPVCKKYANTLHGLVAIALRTADTFGRDVEEMISQKLTFEEALSGNSFTIMANDLNMLAKRVIRPALRNRKNYRDGESKNWKPLEWQGFYSLRRGIGTKLTAMTRDPMAAKGLLRHSSVNTTLKHYIKDVPEVTANGMAQVEELFSELDAANQVVQ